jgi:hypothetical protein
MIIPILGTASMLVTVLFYVALFISAIGILAVIGIICYGAYTNIKNCIGVRNYKKKKKAEESLRQEETYISTPRLVFLDQQSSEDVHSCHLEDSNEAILRR